MGIKNLSHHTAAVAGCNCGARAFEERRAAQRALNRIPLGGPADVYLIKQALETPSPPSPTNAEIERDALLATRKRSLWRKLLGKGPKCICVQLEHERRAKRLGLVEIPDEYVGCVSVRVAGKRVPFTRDMQLKRREQFVPLEAIVEAEDDV
ncbi:hypothetical protein P43SY_003573 [Pythium insidiosum]|uniref:Uncharacterized protein n=1 Tax=Pythium insidiosum TaxID=114742 RepID=A0AAD5Q555_PYTIN|nr:hypothetical protein P43SY_003573 [Pythium insidiosum]